MFHVLFSSLKADDVHDAHDDDDDFRFHSHFYISTSTYIPFRHRLVLKSVVPIPVACYINHTLPSSSRLDLDFSLPYVFSSVFSDIHIHMMQVNSGHFASRHGRARSAHR